MEQVVHPWIQRTYEDLDVAYIFQQDGAPGMKLIYRMHNIHRWNFLSFNPILAHTGSRTQSWMEDNLDEIRFMQPQSHNALTMVF